MKKILASAALALPLLTAGYAVAGEPMRLTDDQMDGVSAGASAIALASAAGIGNVVLAAAKTAAGVAVVDYYASEQTYIALHLSESLAAAAVSAH